MTPEQEAALDAARALARAGAPIFLAAPDPTRESGFALPPGYQRAAPDPRVVDQWRPGWALCMTTGVALDVVDVDLYAGAQVPAQMPHPYAVAATPSGGRHVHVAPLGVRSLNGAYPHVDVKSGDPDGEGRGFAYLPPTERPSKVDGVVRPYRWVSPPDPSRLPPGGPDGTGEPMVRHVLAGRAARRPGGERRRIAESAWTRECRAAVDGLAADLVRWAAGGWGGQARNGLLAASTHLARLSPDHAEVGWLEAFRRAGIAPDERDMRILESAVDQAVPDLVVPDSELTPQERFWLGGAFAEPPKGEPGPAEATRAERGGYRLYTEEELDEIPDPEPLVEGLLFRATIARVFGPSGVGKSWVVGDLAAHVANGLPWLGLPVKQGPVAYVAAEGGSGMGSRLRTWRAAHGRRSGVLTWPEPVAVLGGAWAEFVEVMLSDYRPVLVVLDTQNAVSAGVRENSNDDAGDVLRALSYLVRRTGCCALLVHHTGHEEQERARGASALYAGLDTELQLAERRGGIVLRNPKQKYARRHGPVAIDVSEEHGGWVLRAAEQAGHFGPTVDDRARELLALLNEDPKAHPSMSNRQLEGRLRDLGRAVGNRANSPAKIAVRLFTGGGGFPSRPVAEDEHADE